MQTQIYETMAAILVMSQEVNVSDTIIDYISQCLTSDLSFESRSESFCQPKFIKTMESANQEKIAIF